MRAAVIVAVMGLLYVAPSPCQDSNVPDNLACPSDLQGRHHSHPHMLQLDANGQPVVYKFDNAFRESFGQPAQPDIVMDGLCHDDTTEDVIDDPSRKVLPVPPSPKEDIS
jgi:hypothetical protein